MKKLINIIIKILIKQYHKAKKKSIKAIPANKNIINFINKYIILIIKVLIIKQVVSKNLLNLILLFRNNKKLIHYLKLPYLTILSHLINLMIKK
jgi:hypothetical protein